MFMNNGCEQFISFDSITFNVSSIILLLDYIKYFFEEIKFVCLAEKKICFFLRALSFVGIGYTVQLDGNIMLMVS